MVGNGSLQKDTHSCNPVIPIEPESEKSPAMTWTTHNERKFYHRFRKVGGKVEHTYVGTGPLARLAAECDLHQRQQRQLYRQERDRWIAALKQERMDQQNLDLHVEMLLRAELLFAGFYLWHRCKWRKRDMNPTYNPQSHRVKTSPPRQPPPATQAVSRPRTIAEELQRLVAAANTGHPASRQQLRQFLVQHPNITRHCGDLMGHAKETLLRRISSNDALLGESIRLELERLKQELLPPNPRAVHLLAVERVLLNFIEIHLYDTLYPDIASLDPPRAKVVSIAKNSAERRYSQSLRTLAALVRALPAKKRQGDGWVTPGLKVHAAE